MGERLIATTGEDLRVGKGVRGGNRERTAMTLDLLGPRAAALVTIAVTLLLLASTPGTVIAKQRCHDPLKPRALTSARVVERFRSAGLQAEGARPMTPDDWGIAPLLTQDATRFFVPSLGVDNGGRAFIFKSAKKLNTLNGYYDDLSETSALFFSWTFANCRRGVLVQINGDLPAEQAAPYARIVRELGS